MLIRYGLTDSSTALLAQIIRATPAKVAGTTRAKVFGGSFTVSTLGLCDNDILEREFIVYGALYA
jgi:hypothetical protein